MLSSKQSVLTVLALTAFLAGGLGFAEEAPTKNVYPLDVCSVTGSKLGGMGDPIVYDHEGREVRFCCGGCVGKFKKEPEKYLEKIDKAIVKQQLPLYPMDTCLVSGEKLGSLGDPIDKVYDNRLVRFCCKGCVGKFEQDPKKYLTKLDKAVIKKQKDSYPLDTCLVSGDKLGAMGDPIDKIYGGRLVRFCCKGCIEKVNKNPVKYLKMLDKAWADAKAASAEGGASAAGDETPQKSDE